LTLPRMERPVVRALVVYVVYSLLCTRIPLLNYLGYEFSSATAFVGSILSGFVVITMVRPAYRDAQGGPHDRTHLILNVLNRTAKTLALLLLIPFVVISFNALFVRNCSLIEGAGFFLLLSAVGVAFGASLGFFSAVMFRNSRLMFGAACLALILYSVGLGYWTPALYSYNFLYGYFPGLTYDESVPLTVTLLAFRIVTLLVSGILILLGLIVARECEHTAATERKFKRLASELVRYPRWIPALLILLALGGLYWYRCEIGFESTAGFIRQTLGASYRTEHFTIYYDPVSMDSAEARRVAAEHEFRLYQVLSEFSYPERVSFDSYVYPSPEAKRRLIGAGNTDITKPWSGQIHLSRQSLESSLKHELVHVAAAPFGIPVLRASLSTGLVEGLAMAVDGTWGNRTLHEYAAGMRAVGIAPDIRTIMTPWGFVSEQPAVSYVLAGSFCRYLIDRFGMRRLLSVYRGADYTAIYGRSLERLDADWRGFLDRVPLDRGDLDAIDATFRRPTIFRKVCPRVLARRIADAHAAFTAKQYTRAESLYASSYADGRGYEAFAGYLTSAVRDGGFDRVIAAFDTVILRDDHPARFLHLFVGIGDSYWKEENTLKAYALYDRVRRAAVSGYSAEATALRILAMKEDPDGRLYLPVFLSDASDTARLTMVDSLLREDRASPMLLYLRGRLLLSCGDYAASAGVLKSLDLSGSDQILEAVRLQSLGRALLRMGRYEESRAAYWMSLNFTDRQIDKERVDDLLDRCEWMRDHGL